MANPFRYVILGAGCAGLSLCHALLRHGVTDPILLLDSRTEFTNDRTWCFWNERPTPFSPLATHRWGRWQVWDDAGRHAGQTSGSAAYLRLRGADFYAFVLAAIAESPNVTLRLGEAVTGHEEDGNGVTIHTQAGESVRGDFVFDSTAPADSEPHDTPLTFRQHFLGQTLRAPVPCFDPEQVTLMDFRVGQGRGLHFFYVLPLSKTEALVENTYILGDGAPAPTAHDYRCEIAAYAGRRLGLRDFTVTAEEAGAIPMTLRRFPLRRGARTFFLGTAGGAVRPSSGYAFLRIQDHSERLAAALAAGRPGDAPRRIGRRRSHFFDTVFLTAMQSDPARVPGYFQQIFARTPPLALARFLTETGTWADDLAVVAALCPTASAAARFARTALRSLIPSPQRPCARG